MIIVAIGHRLLPVAPRHCQWASPTLEGTNFTTAVALGMLGQGLKRESTPQQRLLDTCNRSRVLRNSTKVGPAKYSSLAKLSIEWLRFGCRGENGSRRSRRGGERTAEAMSECCQTGYCQVILVWPLRCTSGCDRIIMLLNDPDEMGPCSPEALCASIFKFPCSGSCAYVPRYRRVFLKLVVGWCFVIAWHWRVSGVLDH
jgi:hypothetical protein